MVYVLRALTDNTLRFEKKMYSWTGVTILIILKNQLIAHRKHIVEYIYIYIYIHTHTHTHTHIHTHTLHAFYMQLADFLKLIGTIVNCAE